MDVSAGFIAHAEPAKLVEPGQGALHHPAMAPQLLTGVEALAGDADLDVAPREGATAAGDVVGFVGMQLVWPLAAAVHSAACWAGWHQATARRRRCRAGWPP